MKTLLLSFVALGTVAFAANTTFRVHISQDSQIEGKTVKAGTYKVSVENGNAVLKQGRETIEVPAHEQTTTEKAESTEIFYKNNTIVQKIKVGGTNTTIVFDNTTQPAAGL